MKKTWLPRTGFAVALIVGATACANLIGLSDYEVDESTPSSGGAAGAGTGGAGGTAAGSAGTSAGTAGSGGSGGCIPTANTRQCAANSECCEFSANRASCVNFPDRGAFCASRCTTNSECGSNCCATLDSGNKACAFPEFCEGTGGTGGVGGAAGSGGGIGSPCSTSGAACGSGTNTGTCNGFWCTKPCTRSVDCPGNTFCIKNNAGTNTCFVACTTTASCAPFTGTTCQSGTDLSNNPISICSLPPSN